MEKLRAGLEFIFSSYKRTATVLIIFALALAIPVTLSFLGQQQDIRQRAEEGDEESTVTQAVSEEELRSFCDQCLSGGEEFACGRIRDGKLNVACKDGTSSSYALCISCKNLPIPPPCPIPPVCQPGQTLVGGDPTPNSTCTVYECTGNTTCGDGICQNIACLGLNNCPVPETPINCPQDCSATPTATPTQTPIPTTTSHPSETRINLSLQLTGIGNATESARGINNRPKRPARNVDIKFLNSQNQEVLSRSGAVHFDAASGLYKGTTTLGANFQGGPYIVKVRTDNTLWKQVPGIQNIVAGTTYELPLTQLVTGDVNQDNEINLNDYTIFLTCYRGRCEGFPLVKLDLDSLMYAFNIKSKHE